MIVKRMPTTLLTNFRNVYPTLKKATCKGFNATHRVFIVTHVKCAETFHMPSYASPNDAIKVAERMAYKEDEVNSLQFDEYIIPYDATKVAERMK